MKADIAAIRARNEERKRGLAGGASACAEDVDALLAALDEALKEAARLREEHGDLHASAVLWANLYAGCTGNAQAPPAHVQQYAELLESIRVLREAIESFLKECVSCAPWDAAMIFDRTQRKLCAQCLRGLTALRLSLNPGDA